MKITGAFILVVILTILTQIGGLVFLFSLLAHPVINRRFSRSWVSAGVKIFFFLALYLFCVFIIVPMIAKPFGRVPLPLLQTHNLQPGNMLTFFLNRNYVRRDLRLAAFQVAEKMGEEYPGTVVNYLDGNFPFVDQFPLLPHRSHNDGRKLDVSFAYKIKGSGEYTDELPSFTGYGVCEEPKANEQNTTELCIRRGYWQYDLLQRLVSQGAREKVEFDPRRTKRLAELFAEQRSIGRIFLEPHLKKRLKLISDKIRFHGCQAVRHDDHLHIQLK